MLNFLDLGVLTC